MYPSSLEKTRIFSVARRMIGDCAKRAGEVCVGAKGKGFGGRSDDGYVGTWHHRGGALFAGGVGGRTSRGAEEMVAGRLVLAGAVFRDGPGFVFAGVLAGLAGVARGGAVARNPRLGAGVVSIQSFAVRHGHSGGAGGGISPKVGGVISGVAVACVVRYSDARRREHLCHADFVAVQFAGNPRMELVGGTVDVLGLVGTGGGALDRGLGDASDGPPIGKGGLRLDVSRKGTI